MIMIQFILTEKSSGTNGGLCNKNGDLSLNSSSMAEQTSLFEGDNVIMQLKNSIIPHSDKRILHKTISMFYTFDCRTHMENSIGTTSHKGIYLEPCFTAT